MTQPNLHETSQVAQAALLQHLQAAGLESVFQDGDIFVNLPGIESIVVRALEVSPTDEGAIAHIGVQVNGEALGEEGMIDVIAGIERAPYLAARSAIDKWMRHTFPPIRATFADEDSDPVRGVGITQLVARNDEQWQILSGNPMMIGIPQDQIDFDNATREKRLFPGYIGDSLAERLGAEERQIHWLKAYLGWSNGRVIAECQFDNHDWLQLGDLVASEFVFPPLSGAFLSMAQFLVIRPA